MLPGFIWSSKLRLRGESSVFAGCDLMSGQDLKEHLNPAVDPDTSLLVHAWHRLF